MLDSVVTNENFILGKDVRTYMCLVPDCLLLLGVWAQWQAFGEHFTVSQALVPTFHVLS